MTSHSPTSWILAVAALATLCAAASTAADDAPTSSEERVKQLTIQLGDPDAIVRLKAAKMLGEMGPAARAAIPALTKLLEDPDEDVRGVAERALGKLHAPDDGSIRKLVAELADADPMVRLKAAKALGELGPAAGAAVPALRRLADDPDEDVRQVAESAIRKILSRGDVPPPAGPAKPEPADVTVTDVRSLYCKPYRDPVGLRSTPAQRYFLVRLRNDSSRPVVVEELVVTWQDEGRELDPENVEIRADTVFPGEQVWTWFVLDCGDSDYTWRIHAAKIAERELDDAKAEKIRRQSRQCEAMHLKRIRPVTSMGTVLGHEFTVDNSSGSDARGVRVAFFGFDAADKLVEIQVLYSERLPPGELRLVWSLSRPEDFQKALSFFTLEELFSADRIVTVERYTGEVLAVGASSKLRR